jgi:Ulp1 protease family, C-terminal catalytic domain
LLKGQLYGNLSPDDDITKELFAVGNISISHLYLKSLESKPSTADCKAINSFFIKRNIEAWEKQEEPKPAQPGQAPTFHPGWLFDNTIDAYLTILARISNVIYAIDSVLIGGLIKSLSTAHVQVPKEVKYFIMPFSKANHWTLIFVDIKKGHIMHADSLSGPLQPSGPGPICSTILENNEVKMLQASLMANYGVKCSGNLIRVSCGQQKGYIDCGIFVIHYAECLLQGIPLTAPCNTTEIRKRVFNALINDEGNKL